MQTSGHLDPLLIKASDPEYRLTGKAKIRKPVRYQRFPGRSGPATVACDQLTFCRAAFHNCVIKLTVIRYDIATHGNFRHTWQLLSLYRGFCRDPSARCIMLEWPLVRAKSK